MNDAELVQSILSRDKRALSLFYHTYAPKLRRFIKMKIENTFDAEEILQDTLYAFLEALRDFHGESSVKTFLFSICQHKIIDFYRKKKIKHIVFSQIPFLENLVSPIINPEEALDGTLFREKIYSALSHILPRYREIILYKYMDNMSVDEIAKKLSLSFKSVESRLFRARKAFVEAFVSI